MNFHIITIFPKIFDSYFSESIIKRASEKNIINLNVYNLRDWTTDKHKRIDDTPYGGGAGMLMQIKPLYESIKDIKLKINDKKTIKNEKIEIKTILLSAKGSKWNQQRAQIFSKEYTDIILICGRYEGVDERINYFIDKEISIGDFILTGGEIGALTLVDSISRLLPGVLGNKKSAISESHSIVGRLEYPQYTKPEIFKVNGKDYRVPKILLSGNHKEIENWKKTNSKSVN